MLNNKQLHGQKMKIAVVMMRGNGKLDIA